jgi:hypothetical protein
MPERPGVVIFTDDFLHLKCSFAAFDRRRLSRGDRESRARPPSGLQLLIDDRDGDERLTPILIACPFVPEKFLKHFTALLREDAAVDIAAMI